MGGGPRAMTKSVLIRVVLSAALALVASGCLAAAAEPSAPQQVTANASASNLDHRRDGVDVRVGAVLMRVTALTDQIVRVRIARDGVLPEDASWAVSAATRQHSVAVQGHADGFSTAALRVRVASPSLRLVVEDLHGKVISADAAEPFDADGRAFTLRKQLPQAEHIFGMGDKTGGSLDRRGQSYVDWNTDAFGFSSATDPIYKSIPFFIGVGGAGGSYGILLDNSWRSWFDFGHRDADTLAFGAPDGPIDYYLIAGPSTAEVVRRYTDLTGKAPLPPRWAFGYQQSCYSYMTGDEVRQVAARLRADKFPADVIWLDIDFQDRNRPFTVNKQAFPDLPGLVRHLQDEGMKLVVIADLHVARAPGEGYAPYDSGTAADAFVHNPDGSIYVAPVWPGPSVFPDFTETRVRDWWGTLYQPFVADGIAGFWNDMNEPAVFDTPTKTMPLDTVHRIATDDFADRKASHAEVHNIYGMQNTRATYDGLRKLRPDERPFVMTRASYAGGQRYAVTWTGDNSSTWDQLKLSVHQLINLGLSGFSYSAADVGGFAGGPSAELLTRWFEIAAFTPVFRDHAAKGTPRAEPWVDGPEHLAIRRRYVEERYRLLPYFYALADENARHGDPIMRPVFYDYPDAISASCDPSMAFTVGSQLLVAPPPNPESPQDYDVCLPAGGWYDYWTGLAVENARTDEVSGPVQSASQATNEKHASSGIVKETPRLDKLPVFVRAGSILPRQPLVQSTAQTPAGPLQIDVYPGADCHGQLYADDGHSMAYRKQGFLRQSIRCTVTADGVRIDFAARDGQFQPWWNQLAVTVHGWIGAGHATAGRHRVEGMADSDAQALRFTIADQPAAASIEVVHH